MTAPLALVLFAAAMGTVGTRWLVGATWPNRAPGLGVLAWQTLTFSVFLSLTLAGFSLAIPRLPATEGIAEFLHACSVALRDHYSTPGGAILSVAGGLLALGLLTRLGYALTRDVHVARRDRARQHHLVRLVSRSHPEPDVMVLQDATPAAYCLPGRPKQVVITEGALRVLTDDQLRQVLAHERAHIRARHHLALLGANSLAYVLFNQLGSKTASRQIADLAEMHADDVAAGAQRLELAAAVIALAGGAHPAGALGSTGGSTRTRVERLAGPPTSVSLLQRLMVIGLLSLCLVIPIILTAAPALTAVLIDYCPVLTS